MASLTFTNVDKRFGPITALRDFGLAVRDGELVVLVGPSGCGKSTALRVAAGLEEVSAGRIRIGERDVTTTPPGDRHLALVFQSYALYPHLSAFDNIGFGLPTRRGEREQTRARVLEAAALTHAEHLLDRRPGELSGGERQRVALARAIVRQPDAFLLDEPLSSLDAQLRVATRGELRRLHRQLGATMLYVTHDQLEALTLGERVAVLHEGVLQQIGTPDDVYRRPLNRFVARFVGSPPMNVLPAEVDDGVLHAGPFRFQVPEDAPRLDDRAIEVGVRPEDLDLATDGGAPGTVAVVEAAGPDAYLHVDADGVGIVVRVTADVRPTEGDAVRVVARPRRGYVFDAETGETLAVDV